MIPVLGVPVLNRPDLLDAMIASIDAPVDRLLVIDNGGVVDRDDCEVIDPGANLGVAASWNLIVKATAGAPWWALVNADVVFGPGALEALASEMATDHPRVAMLVEFGAFGLNAATIERVGWFDEGFHPIYCEDVDYRYRCRLAGVEVVDIPNESTHVNSATYRSEPRLHQANARTYPLNVAYYQDKWGGPMGHERFTTPFDRGGSVADWTLSLARIREQSWT